MKEIKNRGELVELLNESKETIPVELSTNKKTFHSIYFNKKNNEYYRIIWGEVEENNVVYLWYNPKMECVKFNKRTASWMTSTERKSYKKEMEEKEKDLIFNSLKNGKTLFLLDGGIDNLEDFQFIGGKTGAGKSEYAYKEAVKFIKKGEKVLIFSLESEEEEVRRRVIRSFAHEAYNRLEKCENSGCEPSSEDVFIIQKAAEEVDKHLVIYHSYDLTKEKIVSKIIEEHNKRKVSFVVVDPLHMIKGVKESFNQIEEIHEYIDGYRQDLDIKVLITVQVNNK